MLRAIALREQRLQEILILAAQRIRYVLHRQRYGGTANRGQRGRVTAATASAQHQPEAHGDDKDLPVSICPDHDVFR
jgi:hypothetical protein